MAVVVFDSSVLLLLIHPATAAPLDPQTGKPLENAMQRVDYLIETLSKTRSKAIIPSPVLTEVLIHAGEAMSEYISRLRQPPFKVEPFDSRAAIECAEAIRKYGLKKKQKDDPPRVKVKFDRQIVSIAQVVKADTIYADDTDIFKYGEQCQIPVVRSWELQENPLLKQKQLDLGT